MSHFRFYKTIVRLLMITVICYGCNEKPLTDIDGNIYKTVIIGNQEWMAQNLKTTRYNDGMEIPYIHNIKDWSRLNTPGYCWFDNEKDPYKGHFGGLYNWYAVNSDKLCPAGWRVPGEEDWKKLAEYLGGEIPAGGKLKDTDRKYWVRPNAGATNETGFSAQAGGYRSVAGTFGYRGFDGYWWTVTESREDRAISFHLSYNFSNLGRQNNNKNAGLSVRCIKEKMSAQTR